MKVKARCISSYKNKLCLVNFLFCLMLILSGYVDFLISIKSVMGLMLGTLSPIIWDQWLYDKMFQNSKGNLLISYNFFVWTGFLFAIVISIALVQGFFRRTL